MKINLNLKYADLLKEIRNKIPGTVDGAIILGSGLGDFAKNIDIETSIPTSSLTGYPVSTVQGHEGYIHLADLHNKKILVFQGRIHFYEGYSISDCVLPVHIAYHLGCKKILLTNAAGGINPYFVPGDLMVNTSVISENIKREITELTGLVEINTRNAFLDFPSPQISETIIQAGLEEKVYLQRGVYWFSKGPSYETPAEIKMMAKAGADAVGMSTVHEAIYAAIIGMQVGIISCITNYAAGTSPDKLSHNDVMETAEKVKTKFERLVRKIVELW